MFSNTYWIRNSCLWKQFCQKQKEHQTATDSQLWTWWSHTTWIYIYIHIKTTVIQWGECVRQRIEEKWTGGGEKAEPKHRARQRSVLIVGHNVTLWCIFIHSELPRVAIINTGSSQPRQRILATNSNIRDRCVALLTASMPTCRSWRSIFSIYLDVIVSLKSAENTATVFYYVRQGRVYLFVYSSVCGQNYVKTTGCIMTKF